ncbi:hypothetical protein AOX55_0000440 [Sinorhizobium fredii CCBAU 25509]|nr:hypothetical protein AOX55_0000440 [Sinorhizobium fredii CCBAU 25509]
MLPGIGQQQASEQFGELKRHQRFSFQLEKSPLGCAWGIDKD